MGTGVASTGSPPSLPMPSMRSNAVSLLTHVAGEVLPRDGSGLTSIAIDKCKRPHHGRMMAGQHLRTWWSCRVDHGMKS